MPYTPTFPQRVAAALGARLSRLGELREVPKLIYNPLTLRHFHRVAVHSGPGVVRTFKMLYPSARLYLDVGCGSGAYAAELKRSGLSCVACEHSAIGRRMAHKQGVDCRPFDLSRDPPSDVGGPFDVAFCFEVAEHVPEPLGRVLVHFIANQSTNVVFTAATPGQLGTGHINCQVHAYWIDRFSEAGMKYREDLVEMARSTFRAEDVAYWLISNVLVFERT